MDADLIEAVAQVMQLSSSEEMSALRRVLFPSLICNAARIGSVSRLETIRNAGGNLSIGDYDGKSLLFSRQGRLSKGKKNCQDPLFFEKKTVRVRCPLFF